MDTIHIQLFTRGSLVWYKAITVGTCENGTSYISHLIQKTSMLNHFIMLEHVTYVRCCIWRDVCVSPVFARKKERNQYANKNLQMEIDFFFLSGNARNMKH